MRLDEHPERVEHPLRRREQFVGRRMVGLQRREHRIGRFRGVELSRRDLERILILGAVGLGDRQQAVERQVDHLGRVELLGVRVRAERERAVRFGEQIALQKRLVVAERFHDGVVGRREFAEQLVDPRRP